SLLHFAPENVEEDAALLFTRLANHRRTSHQIIQTVISIVAKIDIAREHVIQYFKVQKSYATLVGSCKDGVVSQGDSIVEKRKQLRFVSGAFICQHFLPQFRLQL